jgi:hypothetical protein
VQQVWAGYGAKILRKKGLIKNNNNPLTYWIVYPPHIYIFLRVRVREKGGARGQLV